MKLLLSCPSKTFLLGEYLVLNDGSAMTLNTAPRFELTVNTRGEGMVSGIAPQSPAGQWIRQNKLVFANVDIDFMDPHMGAGGFGASSAQYLLVNIVTQVLKSPGKNEDFNIEQIWRSYRQLEAVSAEGLRPSGADVVGQYMGGLCGVQTVPFEAKSFRWPFEDFDVVLVPTGKKMATHEHLRGLKRVSTEELEVIYARAMETMAAGDAPAFFDSINDYHAELLEMGFVAEATQVIVTTVLSHPFVRAAKGCGAMGSDVVAIFIAKESREVLNKTLTELGLKIVSSVELLDRGFEIRIDESDDSTTTIRNKKQNESLT